MSFSRKLFIHQMPVRPIIDLIFLQKFDEELVVALWRSYDITSDAVLLCDLGSFLLQRDFADLRGDRMLGDIPERPWHGFDQSVEERLGFVRPEMAALLDPMVLPVQLRHAVRLREHLQKFAEHKEAANRHHAEQHKTPERNAVHKPAIGSLGG